MYGFETRSFRFFVVPEKLRELLEARGQRHPRSSIAQFPGDLGAANTCTPESHATFVAGHRACAW